jgi:hypothetical protein
MTGKQDVRHSSRMVRCISVLVVVVSRLTPGQLLLAF